MQLLSASHAALAADSVPGVVIGTEPVVTVIAHALLGEDPPASIVGSIAAEGLSATAFIGRTLVELSSAEPEGEV